MGHPTIWKRLGCNCKLAVDHCQSWLFFSLFFLYSFPFFIFAATFCLSSLLFALLVLASGAPCQTDGPGPLAFPKGILRKSLHILLCVSAPPSCGINGHNRIHFMSVYTLSILSGH
jgi:hypothetical protein